MSGPRSALAVCALGLLAVVGCKKEKQSAPAPDPATPVAGDQATGDSQPSVNNAGSAAGKNKRKVALVRRKDVKALLDTWLAAQNEGDFARYIATYSQKFHGVRRSGKKTVRLDFAGWKKERKRMFKRAMKVQLRKVEIAVSPSGAEVLFIQDWQSGKYHDVGPKKLLIRKTDAGLRIAREEMLRSTLIGKDDDAALPLASSKLALVYEGALILDDAPDLDKWGKGEPELITGSIPERDEECDDDPPDYEEENDRHFYCASNGPENTTVAFSAVQEVNEKRLPAALSAWKGRPLAIHAADGTTCAATVVGFELRAELDTTASEVGDSDSSEKELAETVLDSSYTHLAGVLDNRCGGADALFARAAELPPPIFWTLEKAAGKAKADIRKGLTELSGDRYDDMADEVIDAAAGPAMESETARPPAGSAGQALAIGVHTGPYDCESDGFVMYIWEAGAAAAGDFDAYLLEDEEKEFQIHAVVDVDGDNRPELITSFGFMTWLDGKYEQYRPMDFPEPVVDACYCGCE